MISIPTNKPAVGEQDTCVNLTYGAFNRVKAEAAVNIPMGEKLAGRLVLYGDRY